jgi:hypothetical protein
MAQISMNNLSSRIKQLLSENDNHHGWVVFVITACSINRELIRKIECNKNSDFQRHGGVENAEKETKNLKICETDEQTEFWHPQFPTTNVRKLRFLLQIELLSARSVRKHFFTICNSSWERHPTSQEFLGVNKIYYARQQCRKHYLKFTIWIILSILVLLEHTWHHLYTLNIAWKQDSERFYTIFHFFFSVHFFHGLVSFSLIPPVCFLSMMSISCFPSLYFSFPLL